MSHSKPYLQARHFWKDAGHWCHHGSSGWRRGSRRPLACRRLGGDSCRHGRCTRPRQRLLLRARRLHWHGCAASGCQVERAGHLQVERAGTRHVVQLLAAAGAKRAGRPSRWPDRRVGRAKGWPLHLRLLGLLGLLRCCLQRLLRLHRQQLELLRRQKWLLNLRRLN